MSNDVSGDMTELGKSESVNENVEDTFFKYAYSHLFAELAKLKSEQEDGEYTLLRNPEVRPDQYRR